MRRLAAGLLLLVTACASEQAGWRLQHLGRVADGQLLLVRREDFPDGDPSHGAPTTVGSAALQDAVVADAGVAAFVRARGLPDAVVVARDALALQLAYLGDGQVYTLSDGAAGIVSPRASAVSAVRELRAEERILLDPRQRAAAQREELRARVADAARVATVCRALLRPLPAAGPAGAYYGLLLVAATPAATALYGGHDSAYDEIVAWVDADGPARDALRVGDRILEVNDLPPHAADDAWQGPQRFIIQRGRDTRRVTVAPEPLPRRIACVALPADEPNATAVEGSVGVTQGLLARLPDDDALAVAMAHELAHITLGHVTPRVTAGSVLKGVVGLGVLLPADIALPGAGELLGGLMQGVENRFNRDQERDADRLGLHYARAAGYDPAAALALLDTLEAAVPSDAGADLLDIHPPYPERRALLEQELHRLQPPAR